ncbi:MAG: fumarylacetoacetate hydrolase family protein [Pseudazoarcus pumilus]|nr:fumarylacetoacetate hydrolase family protein [Pseudazoarcus pumilus]
MHHEDHYVFAPPVRPSLPVRGTAQHFPVHRIYCIGRNYAAHAVEMGHDPEREPPFFFQKSPDNLLVAADFPYPGQSADVQYEFELVVALGRGGRNVPVGQALELVFGYGVGLDMTRRDLQAEAKKLGRPWDAGKAFEHSAPCSELVPVSRIGHPERGAIIFRVNGEVRQSGDLSQMIWKIAEQISILSRFFELQPGDLIMTGTPAGVGAIQRGDVMEGEVEGVCGIRLKVV